MEQDAILLPSSTADTVIIKILSINDKFIDTLKQQKHKTPGVH